MKHLVWEKEHVFLNMTDPTQPGPVTEHHLKVVVPRPDSPRPYKISVAWVNRVDKRKWMANVVSKTTNYEKANFTSLKAAKAWCLAIYRLEN